MTITKGTELSKWAGSVGLKGASLAPFFHKLNERDDADAIILQAGNESWTAERMANELGMSKSAKANPIQGLFKAKPKANSSKAAPGPKLTRAEEIRARRGTARHGSQPPVSGPVLKAAPKPVSQVQPDSVKPEKPLPLTSGDMGMGEFGEDPLVQMPTEPPSSSKPNWLNKKSAGKKGKSGSTGPKMGGSKPKLPKWLLPVVIIVILLAAAGYLMYTGRLGAIFSGGNNSGVSPAQTIPDQSLTDMSPEQKAAWAENQISQSVENTSFSNKPPSFSVFFANWRDYLNWLLSITVVLPLMYSIYKERTEEGESSDVILSNIGMVFLMIAIFFAPQIGPALGASRNLILGFGIFVNLLCQVLAWISGTKSQKHDFSVIAFGLYISGTFLRWWYPADLILSITGLIFVVLGIVVQILEINRNKAMGKSLTVAIIMIICFIGGFLGIYGLIQGQIAALPIPADATAQAVAFMKLSVLSKVQLFASMAVGVVAAWVGGLITGMVILRSSGGDSAFEGQNRKVLDADASSLAMMVLYPLLPVVWLLLIFVK